MSYLKWVSADFLLLLWLWTDELSCIRCLCFIKLFLAPMILLVSAETNTAKPSLIADQVSKQAVPNMSFTRSGERKHYFLRERWQNNLPKYCRHYHAHLCSLLIFNTQVNSQPARAGRLQARTVMLADCQRVRRVSLLNSRSRSRASGLTSTLRCFQACPGNWSMFLSHIGVSPSLSFLPFLSL